MAESEQQSLFDSGEHATPLTPQQLRAAEMLAFGAKKILVQSRQNVSARDLASWERSPNFKAEIDRLRADARDTCIAELRSLGDLATGVIRKILEDEEAPPTARINAAFRLLDLIGVGPGCFATATEPKPIKRSIDAETLQRISAEIYGIED
jgi:hypothetical protein